MLSNGNPRYDALSDIDKRVWDRTHGTKADAMSESAWVASLHQATVDGLISKMEAKAAMARMERMWQKESDI